MYAIPVFVFEKAIYSGLDLYPVTATIPPAGYCFHSQSFLSQSWKSNDKKNQSERRLLFLCMWRFYDIFKFSYVEERYKFFFQWTYNTFIRRENCDRFLTAIRVFFYSSVTHSSGCVKLSLRKVPPLSPIYKKPSNFPTRRILCV